MQQQFVLRAVKNGFFHGQNFAVQLHAHAGGGNAAMRGEVAVRYLALVQFARHERNEVGRQLPARYGVHDQHIQQAVGIGIMPWYLLIFAALNLGMLEVAYRRIDRVQLR